MHLPKVEDLVHSEEVVKPHPMLQNPETEVSPYEIAYALFQHHHCHRQPRAWFKLSTYSSAAIHQFSPIPSVSVLLSKPSIGTPLAMQPVATLELSDVRRQFATWQRREMQAALSPVVAAPFLVSSVAVTVALASALATAVRTFHEDAIALEGADAAVTLAEADTETETQTELHLITSMGEAQL